MPVEVAVEVTMEPVAQVVLAVEAQQEQAEVVLEATEQQTSVAVEVEQHRTTAAFQPEVLADLESLFFDTLILLQLLLARV
jgi:DNA-binding protein